MLKNNFPIIFIMGQTATGKTKISIKIKSIYSNIEIISVDSAAIYRDMNIGTAKPNEYILNKFPHKLINIRDPIQKYSVMEFYNDSINIIEKCFNDNKIPVFVGGSMFYFQKLLYGLSNTYKSNINIINKFIEKNFNKYNKLEIYNKMYKIFPLIIKNVNKNNLYRLKKIIHIYITQGFIKNDINNLHNKYKIYQFCLIHNNNKHSIKKIIKYRFLKMLLCGLENEVNDLFLRKDLNINMQSIKSIGYKQIWLYFLGKLSYNNMIDESISSTLNLIKNQTNWIKKWKDNLIFISNNKLSNKFLINQISEIICTYLTNINK